MTKWLNREMERIEKEEAERPEYMSFEQGTTDVLLNLDIEPREVSGKWGPRKIMQIVMSDGTYKLWGMSPVTFDKMLSTIVEAGLTSGKVNVNVTRVGTGTDTRWSFKA